MNASNDELYVVYVITSDFCCQLIFYASERPTMCQIKITSKYWSRKDIRMAENEMMNICMIFSIEISCQFLNIAIFTSSCP